MVKRGPCERPQASEGEAQHRPFCWTGRAIKETRVCIVDEAGKIVREVRVASEPEALLAVLAKRVYHFKLGLNDVRCQIEGVCRYAERFNRTAIIHTNHHSTLAHRASTVGEGTVEPRMLGIEVTAYTSGWRLITQAQKTRGCRQEKTSRAPTAGARLETSACDAPRHK
jgi:hypothetical protein